MQHETLHDLVLKNLRLHLEFLHYRKRLESPNIYAQVGEHCRPLSLHSVPQTIYFKTNRLALKLTRSQ